MTNSRIKLLSLTLLLCALLSPRLDAQSFSRIACEVLDHNDKPIMGAVVTATTPTIASLTISKTTNKKGKCTISLSDGTVPYTLEITKQGYQTLTAEVQPKLGGTEKRVFNLSPSGVAAESKAVMTTEQKEATRFGSKHVLLYNEGVEAQQAGDYELAMTKFRASAEADPSFVPALTGIATLALEQGKPSEAAEAAERAYAQDPESYQALLLRYNAYSRLGDEKKSAAAAKDLQKAGDITDVALRVFQDAVAAFTDGDMANAKARFHQALELDPELVEAYANLAQIYNKEGNAQQAAVMAAQVIKRNPDNLTALRIRYDALRLLGDEEGAKQALAAVVAADPQWAAVGIFNHAQELFNANRIDEATAALQELLQVQPDHAEAHYLLGLCLNSAGDYAAAKSHFKRFLELAPDHPSAAAAREILQYLP